MLGTTGDGAYPPEVLADGPVAYWRLQENSGAVAADSIGGHDGSFVGSPTLGVAGVPFSPNNLATDFNGSDQRIDVPYSGSLNPSTYTVEAWVRPSSLPPPNSNGIDEKTLICSRSSDGTKGFLLYLDAYTGHPQFALSVGAGTSHRYVYDNVNPAVQAGQWYHVVGAFDGTNLHIFVNGADVTGPQLNDGGGTVMVPNPDQPTRIGMCANSSNSLRYAFGGRIDEVAVYGNVLAPSRVAAHYQAGASAPPVNQSPWALMSGLPVNWTGPYTLAFDGTGSFDPDGQIVSYHWTFGDGGSSSASSPTHAYLGPGTFNVFLIVTDDGGASTTTVESIGITGDPLKDFAPEVRLHPSEDHFPMDPTAFIANSVLGWSHDASCTDDYQVSRPSASKLGGGGYKHQEADDTRCRHFGTSWTSARYTRPFDQGNTGRVPIANEEGFFLNFDAGAEPATFAQAPVWTETTSGLAGAAGDVNTYWFFYGRSVPRSTGIALPFAHEGDWEHANVELNASRAPVNVWYYAHAGEPDKESYVQVQRVGLLHPVVYVAWDAHGSYPTTGTTDVCDWKGCLNDIREDGGPTWYTWLDVRSARGQPWYGYGGAWGEKGESGDTTGPLGPSQYKNPVSQ